MKETDWLVVVVETGTELDGVDWLRRRRVPAYTPRVRDRQRRAHRKGVDVVERAAFAGYLFVRVSGSGTARKVPGFRRWVQCDDGKPLVASNADIQHIIDREVEGEFDAADHFTSVKFQVGERVIVTTGPFAGLGGTVAVAGQSLTVDLDGMIHPVRASRHALTRS
ncbi:MAG: hypothetical protein WCF85_16875 [Rhodospirillaceae bacterium]